MGKKSKRMPGDMTTNADIKPHKMLACTNTSFSFLWLKPTKNERTLTGHEAERTGWKQVVKDAERPGVGLGTLSSGSQ